MNCTIYSRAMCENAGSVPEIRRKMRVLSICYFHCLRCYTNRVPHMVARVNSNDSRWPHAVRIGSNPVFRRRRQYVWLTSDIAMERTSREVRVVPINDISKDLFVHWLRALVFSMPGTRMSHGRTRGLQIRHRSSFAAALV